MARARTSAIPPTMYRHFAVVTVLLTAGIAMFADGENREAAAAQVAERAAQEEVHQERAVKPAKPSVAHRVAEHRQRFVQNSGGFDGFDASFGAPMERAVGSLASHASEAVSEAKAGYSDKYLASLSVDERDLLLQGLEKEGMLSPEERDRKSAALIATSQARGGTRTADF